jgi:hypothetical protein
MEPIEAERPAAALSKEEKRHAEDMAVCGGVGEEFGLGTVESVSRSMDDPSGLSVLGCLFILGSLFIGLPVGIGVGFSSVSPTAKSIVAAIFGGMFVLGWPAAAISTRYQVVGNRIALYSGGVAQLRRKEPEPRVLHWADIETVTIKLTRLHYFDPTRVPNAIFFAHVLARAATHNGIRVDGYEQSGQGHSQEA